MATTDAITGGCHCDAVRYEIKARPLGGVLCQCRDCQRFSGSGHMASIVFPADAVTLTGETRTYRYAGGSGSPVLNVFCPNCGSPVYGCPEGNGLRAFRASSLDDPKIFAPDAVIYASRAQPWDHPNPALPKFAESPAKRSAD